jgi:hypothetical protein
MAEFRAGGRLHDCASCGWKFEFKRLRLNKSRLRRDGQLLSVNGLLSYERRKNLRRAKPAIPTMPVPSRRSEDGSGVVALPNDRS